MALYLQRSPEALSKAMEADAKIEELQDLQVDTAKVVFSHKKEIKSLRLCIDALLERVTTLEMLVGRRCQAALMASPPLSPLLCSSRLPVTAPPGRSGALFRLERED